ncbi:MAG: DUF1622 domain-containing protein [Nocardioidaceae bacterium]
MDSILTEEHLQTAVDVLVRLVEAAGAVVIFVGALVAFIRVVAVAVRERRVESFVAVRLGLGRFLALGLEFQLAGDILRTAIAPTFEEIGQLAAVATIRTALNFFLSRELAEERAELARDNGPSAGAGVLPKG